MIKVDRYVNEEKRLIVRQGDKGKYLIERYSTHKGIFKKTEIIQSGYRTLKEAVSATERIANDQ